METTYIGYGTRKAKKGNGPTGLVEHADHRITADHVPRVKKTNANKVRPRHTKFFHFNQARSGLDVEKNRRQKLEKSPKRSCEPEWNLVQRPVQKQDEALQSSSSSTYE